MRENCRAPLLCVWERNKKASAKIQQFHSYHYQLAISARQKPSAHHQQKKKRRRAIIIKTATNYLNWIKRQQFFLHFSSSHSAPSRVIWGDYLLLCLGIAQARRLRLRPDMYLHRNRVEEEGRRETKRRQNEKKSELNKHHVRCWWLYMWRLETVGNSEPKHSQEMNSWIKDGAPRREAAAWRLDFVTRGKFVHGDFLDAMQVWWNVWLKCFCRCNSIEETIFQNLTENSKFYNCKYNGFFKHSDYFIDF